MILDQSGLKEIFDLEKVLSNCEIKVIKTIWLKIYSFVFAFSKLKRK